MSQDKQPMNSHIEAYLDYYCNLPHSPEFAVLLQGQWGSGKTWFINKYRKKLKDKKNKCLYVSLYGMTSFSEIEYAFFQQLHPVLSSKGMTLASTLFKSVAKATLKIDFDTDGREDGTLNVQIPEINLPDYLKSTEKIILIFDDLERCKIDLSNILGYINFFVEHQGLKVILLANEDELEKNLNYRLIKEKLIGKTFGVSLDFEGALEYFITMVDNSDVKEFLSENIESIQNLCKGAKYENLRSLKQIVLDFERMFELLPEKIKREPEILKNILLTLMAFSIEIRRGNMLPKDISKLRDEYISGMSKIVTHQSSNIVKENKPKELNSVQEAIKRYPSLNFYDPFPSRLWWEIFFDKGVLDSKELEQSILNSRYFQNKDTPNWIKLWRYYDLSDDDFDSLIKMVELEYKNRAYVDVGEVMHIFGLFLTFSDAGFYAKDKEEILKEAKQYIDYLISYLKDNNYSALLASLTEDRYKSLDFQGTDFEEFQELSSYINEAQELAKEESMLTAGQDLLATMESDIQEFARMITLPAQSRYELSHKYYEVPILKYIQPSLFVEKLLSISPDNQRRVFHTLTQRYKFKNINENLAGELIWLKSVEKLLQTEATNKEGKLSGFILNLRIKNHLNEAIKKLETDGGKA